MNDQLKGYDYYQAVYLGDELERFHAKVEGEFLTFQTNHLSQYAILGSSTPFANTVSTANPPTNLKLEALGGGSIKATWNRPSSVSTIPLYEYEVELFHNGKAVKKEEVSYSSITFTNLPSDNVNEYGLKVRAKQGLDGVGDPDILSTFYVTVWTEWSSEATCGSLEAGGENPPITVQKGDVNGDGRVDLLDLRMVLRHICNKNLLSESEQEAANMVGDEVKIDLLDLRAMLRKICGKV